MTSHNPITFLANVKRIFSAATGLTTIATWGYPTYEVTELVCPIVFIQLIGNQITWYSTANPNDEIKCYVRFVIVESQTTSTASLGTYFSSLIDAVKANPTLNDSNGAATCVYFGATATDPISYEIGSVAVAPK